MNKLMDAIFSNKKVVVITGAGISTLSGISDFRGKNGLYTKDDSIEYKLSRDYFIENPKEFYKFYKANMIVKDRQPNIIHQTLTMLEEKGYIDFIITQNIDNLHEKSGSKNILAMHGNGEKFYCTKCKKNYNLDEYLNDGYICDKCNGVIRPDVVLYNESIPVYKRRKAFEEIVSAEVVIVLGSSLVVSTVAELLDWYIMENNVNKNDNKLFIINDQETPYDFYSSKYSCDLGEVFANIFNNINEVEEKNYKLYTKTQNSDQVLIVKKNRKLNL